MQKSNEKQQWEKPVVKELDIAKTMSGNLPGYAEGSYLGTTKDGLEIYGTPS